MPVIMLLMFSMFEVLALMWVGRERRMMQKRSVGGGRVEVNVHEHLKALLAWLMDVWDQTEW